MTPLELFKEHLCVVAWVVARYVTRYRQVPPDDLRQAASLGLWTAVQEWHRESVTGDLRWYAYAAARNAVRNELRTMVDMVGKGRREELRKRYPAPRRKWKPLEEVEDCHRTPLPFEDREFIVWVVGQLPDNGEGRIPLRVLARRCWLEGLSLKTVAHQFGVGEAYVRGRLQRAYDLACHVVKRWERGHEGAGKSPPALRG